MVYNAGHVSDTWKFKDRLTLNLGVRFERYVDEFPEQSLTPEGHAALANWPADSIPTERERYMALIAPETVEARTVADTFNVSPRAGFAYDLTGDNRTVVKGYYGRFYFNSADTLADRENPVGDARLRYQFLDATATACSTARGTGRLPQALGNAGAVEVDDNIQRPYSQEFSGSPRTRDRRRAVRARLLRLQAGARRMGGDRPDARGRDDHSLRISRHRRGRRARDARTTRP